MPSSPVQVRDEASLPADVTLYWLPLGAGGHCIRLNGRIFEALQARHQHRPGRDLYHSALQVRLGAQRFVIEMTPVLGGLHTDRGVVREGPVGARLLGRSPLFRYEIRRWRDGTIPDLAEAVAGPHLVSADATRAREVLRLAPLVPTLVWGRDEARTGEMWNSNSLTAWLLAASGHRMENIRPPAHGRAPGWQAGLVVAARRNAFRHHRATSSG
ncbi:hypothetical protein [Actinoplanes utahensis]|uniref:hypothetical protein n=1 Tax=Actinoplanes utahensis TaxID=1869 RepID=UPI00068C5C9F|nr:hypothetical protein [Actinoplanes utahensis]GIF32568.1 hypothetical protein Aut01nite_55540 [Actinoplanes utahensis]